MRTIKGPGLFLAQFARDTPPPEDVFDGDTFDMFLDAVGGHKRCNINYDASHFIKQGLDYVGFIDVYRDRIKMFHVKDAEFNPTAKLPRPL